VILAFLLTIFLITVKSTPSQPADKVQIIQSTQFNLSSYWENKIQFKKEVI